MSLSREITEYALELGFDKVGFAAAEPFKQLVDSLDERNSGYSWVSEGLLQLRNVADPRFVLPDAKTLLVLIYDYHKQAFPQELLGKVGKAYQARLYVGKKRLFGSRLHMLKDFLEQRGIQVGVRPALPDRQAALRAGLGSFGRNTFIYAPGRGSFVAIITMAINVKIESEAPEMAPRCPDDCRRCLDACPTGALYEPYKMDPLRCIAFHTYGTSNFPGAPETIPYEIREKMGSWIYGCDICQDACPRNEKQLSRKLPPDVFLHEVAARDLELTKLLNMDQDYFQQRVNPLLYGYIWEKKFLQRNAAIALGNTGDSSALPHLQQALRDPEEMVRSHAAYALGRLREGSWKTVLETALSAETSPQVKQEIKLALEL